MSMIAVPLQIPDHVQAFADQIGLSPHLLRLTETLQRVFGDAAIGVDLHHDPEADALSWIVFSVEGNWRTYDEEKRLRDRWLAESAACCPSAMLGEFSVHLRSRPA
jgi:hypothetical protein